MLGVLKISLEVIKILEIPTRSRYSQKNERWSSIFRSRSTELSTSAKSWLFQLFIIVIQEVHVTLASVLPLLVEFLQYYSNIIDKFWSKSIVATSNLSHSPRYVPFLPLKMVFYKILSRILLQINI